MKHSEIDKLASRRSVFSLFFNIIGRRERGNGGLDKLQLFGMSGTLGHGSVKHCDAWEFGEGNPENVAVRQEIAQRRREEASERLNGEKTKGFYDFIIR